MAGERLHHGWTWRLWVAMRLHQLVLAELDAGDITSALGELVRRRDVAGRALSAPLEYQCWSAYLRSFDAKPPIQVVSHG